MAGAEELHAAVVHISAGQPVTVRFGGVHYAGTQNTDDTLTGAVQGDEWCGTVPHSRSRFYGKGRMTEDQGFYNMQAQFFDQAIHS